MISSKRNESSKEASFARPADCKQRAATAAAVACAALLLLAVAFFALLGCGASNPAAEPVDKAQTGDVVQFGDYQ